MSKQFLYFFGEQSITFSNCKLFVGLLRKKRGRKNNHPMEDGGDFLPILHGSGFTVFVSVSSFLHKKI